MADQTQNNTTTQNGNTSNNTDIAAPSTINSFETPQKKEYHLSREELTLPNTNARQNLSNDDGTKVSNVEEASLANIVDNNYNGELTLS